MPATAAASAPGMSGLAGIQARIEAARSPNQPPVRLLAVSKGQSVERIRLLAQAGQREFGENYVQEAIAKIVELADATLRFHLIGPLQSNKCELVARHFAGIESLDRAKLVPLLAAARPAALAPLEVLVQVKLDAEASKSGAAPEAVPALCAAVAREPRLALRGLMAIPAPDPDPAQRRKRFAQLAQLYADLRADYPAMDRLSIGMSDDFELAIAAGATEVRIGSALFGPRAPRDHP